MSRNTIELVLKGTSQNVGGTIEGAVGGLRNLGQAATTALGTLAGNLITGAIQKIGELGRAIGETLLNEAPALDQVTRSFENLAASAGASADEVLASMREASNYMVSDADLMTSYNEALLLVGESMATEFPGLLEIAQASAGATGESVGFMLDSLVKGIGRASPMILDNLGLTINSAEAYAAYAAELGISTEEMSKAQQQEALLNAVLAQGGEFVERLGDNTGGAAASIGQMRATVENLTNGIAAALLPAVGALLTPLGQLASEYGPQVVAWAETAGLWLGENLPRAIQGLKAIFAGDVQTAIANFGAIVKTTLGDEAASVFLRLTAWFQDRIPAALSTLRGIWETVWPQIQAVVATVVAWFQANLPLIQETARTLVDFFQNHVAPTLDNVWNIIVSVVDTAVSTVTGVITVAMNVINGNWGAAWDGIKQIAANVWQNIVAIVTNFLEGVLNAIGSSLDQFRATWEYNWNTAKQIVTNIWTLIKTAISEKMTEVKTAVQTALDNVKAFIGAFSLRDVGQALIQGLIDGAKAMASNLVDAVRGVVQGAVDAAKNLLGIQSPSKVFGDMGVNIMASLADKVRAMAGEPLAALEVALQPVVGLADGYQPAAASGTERGPQVSGPLVAVQVQATVRDEADIERLATRVSDILGERLKAYGY